MSYYDGTRLLSTKDINGKTPEIYITTTNRTGGKTVYFSRLVVNRFLKKGNKFALLYRFNYELDDVADKFFKDIGSLFFPGWYMRSDKKAKGIYHELYLCDYNEVEEKGSGKHCGYAIALNAADQIKKYSHLFSDVDCIIFDEFQSETNHYCNDEIKKFISIHTSIARGKGKAVRYVPVYMLSNAVSLINPYYTELGISERLNDEVKFLRGDGFVLEQGYIQSSAEAQKTSGFNRAFANNEYVQYASENVYLNDSQTFIETPVGKNRYLATLRYKGHDYGIREYPDLGIILCSSVADSTYPNKISVTTEDMNVNYVMLNSNRMFIDNMRYYFEKGCFRFSNLKCKEALMKAISY